MFFFQGHLRPNEIVIYESFKFEGRLRRRKRYKGRIIYNIRYRDARDREPRESRESRPQESRSSSSRYLLFIIIFIHHLYQLCYLICIFKGVFSLKNKMWTFFLREAGDFFVNLPHVCFSTDSVHEQIP